MVANQGNKGKFSERIKKIRYDRLRRKNGTVGIEDNDKMYINFMKVVAAIPLLVYDNVFDKSSTSNAMASHNDVVADKTSSKTISRSVDADNFSNVSIFHNDDVADKTSSKTISRNICLDSVSKNGVLAEQSLENKQGNNHKANSIERKKINREKINSIDVSSIRKKQNNYYKSSEVIKENQNKETKILENDDAKKLEKKIINLIKKDLIKTVNELEILESELYLLNEINGDEKTLLECRRNIDEVKKILCKIDILKRKYDFLKDNYDFEYLLELDNNDLIDSIIELKNMFDNNQVRAMVEDYKLLDVYKFLYLRIDQIHDDTERFEEEKRKQEEELKERDINFDSLKDNVYNVEKMNESYDSFVRDQNKFLNDLEEQVSKINSYEVVDYKLKGFGKYLFNSFKYLGLLMMSPLRGVVPSIATQTLVTKNVVSNLYQNLEWEENRKMVYDAIDYSSSIAGAINDLDSTDRVVDSTLDDIIRLKMEYNSKFRMYQGDFSEYEEVIRKINDMENKILGNKIKIEIMKSRMREKERENEHKLKLVRKLNDEENMRAA